MVKNKIIKKIKLGYKYLKLFFIYLPHINLKKAHKKEIIIVFDGNFGHGGLVDRLKGIDYSHVGSKRSREYILKEAKMAGASPAEAEVILKNVLGL